MLIKSPVLEKRGNQQQIKKRTDLYLYCLIREQRVEFSINLPMAMNHQSVLLVQTRYLLYLNCQENIIYVS